MRRTLVTLLVSVLAAPALAQPAPVVRPIDPTMRDRLVTLAVNTQPGQAAKSTYLGAHAAPVPAALADQLKLPPGVGLVVESVDPDSPAAQAGVKPHDVLHKLGDQLLVNPGQLSTLVRQAKAGDAVALAVIRQGAPVTLTAKVIEKEAPANVLTFADRFEAAVPPPAFVFANQDAAAQNTAFAGRNVVIRLTGADQTLEFNDADHAVSLTRHGDATRRAVVKDAKTGKTLFDGPAQTPDERKAIPAELLKKVEQAEQVKPRWQGGLDGGGAGVVVHGGVMGADLDRAALGGLAGAPAARGRVLTWSNADHLLVVRAMGPPAKPTPTYLLALSRKTGQTVFDGPVMTEEQRRAIPAEIAEQFDTVLANPQMLNEFGK